MVSNHSRLSDILAMRARGMTLEECGRETGMTEAEVQRVLLRFAPQSGRPAWSYPDKQLLAEAGRGREEIQRALAAKRTSHYP